MLFDLEGTRHSLASRILLQLYSDNFIRYPICHILVPREIRAKLPELDDLRRRRSKTRCRHKNFHSPLHKRAKRVLVLVSPGLVLVLHHRTLNSAARRVAPKLQSKTFCMLLQRIMGRMSSNKISDTDIDSFPLYPKGWKNEERAGEI